LPRFWNCIGCFILCFLCGNDICAQYSGRLYLSTGTVELAPNTNLTERIKLENPGSLIGGKYYWVLGFYETPGEERKARLREKGITLYDYLPDRSFIASVPQDVSGALLDGLGVRTVYVLQPADKLSPLLRGGDLPWWIITGNGTVTVHVHLYHGISAETLPEQLRKAGVKELRMNTALHLAEVTLPRQQLQSLAALPFVQYVAPIPHPGENENDQSRTNQRSNVLASGGLHFDGSGITIMLDDDGDIGDHIDYIRRTDQTEATNTPLLNDHGDHIAGTLIGAGNMDERYAGMAPGALLRVYTYTSDLMSGTGLMDFPDAYVNHGVVITSTSQSDGCNTGYTVFAQLMDQQTIDHPSLLHVFSAGNSGAMNCGYGAGAGWGNITGGSKMAKNVICVGNVIKNDALSPSSSKGPGTDGRVKPEVVATGVNITSTTDNPAENGYKINSGTSHSTPGVAGMIAQLYNAFAVLNGNALPPSALIKAIVLNTCDDLGNPGPDFSYGYGRVNARRAYRLLSANQYLGANVTQGGNNIHSVIVPANVKELRVLLYWHDPPGSVSAGPSLVNNLDLRVTDPSSAIWDPWVLDATPNTTSLNAPATRNTDNLNNIEQVTVTNPPAGTYQVSVNGSNVPQGPQEYFVVYEFLYDEVTLTYPTGGEHFVPGETELIRWDSYGGTGNFTLSFSTDNGSSWTTAASGIGSGLRYWDWTVPTLNEGDVRMRISRGSVSDISDTTFSVIGVPANLSIDTVCGSEVILSWDAVAGATGYEIFRLGQHYMESAGTTNSLTYTVTGINIHEEQWFSLRALGPQNARGRRTLAVQMSPGPKNCSLANDLALSGPGFPYAGTIPDCLPLAAAHISTRIINNGTNPATGFQVLFQADGGSAVSEVFTGMLQPGEDTLYSFVTPADLSATGAHTCRVWIQYPSDQDSFNDTTAVSFQVAGGTTLPVPFTENMESFALCPTTADCETGACTLGNGWNNAGNGNADNIDWRVNSGETPSPGTGPSEDYDPGTAGGKYIYLESSACYGKGAQLLSGCIDLTGTANPHLRFAYSMTGDSTGTLVAEILHDFRWTEIFRSEGEQPQEWQAATIDLTGFAGDTVLLRFTGITGNDFTSDIALDGIAVSGLLALYSQAPAGSCLDSLITFTDQSIGTVTGYSWNFGPGAIPSSAGTQGPHAVQFTDTGYHEVRLTVTGPEGTNTYTQTLLVSDVPSADFTFALNGTTVQFYNSSENGTSYLWSFGDGDTSAAVSPVHTYDNNGFYNVTLTALNSCTSDENTQLIEISVMSGEIVEEPFSVTVYPNPANDIVYLMYNYIVSAELSIELTDITGKRVLAVNESVFPKKILSIPLSSLANGIYLLKISTGTHNGAYRLVISR